MKEISIVDTRIMFSVLWTALMLIYLLGDDLVCVELELNRSVNVRHKPAFLGNALYPFQNRFLYVSPVYIPQHSGHPFILSIIKVNETIQDGTNVLYTKLLLIKA